MDSGAWNEAVQKTVLFLSQQRESGRKFVPVDQATLKGLKAPSCESARSSQISGKRAAYAQLEAEIKACVKCPHLVSFRTHVVPGVGSLDADIMFVGEAPGAAEDARGEPFVGRAGQLLTRIIKTMGLRREDVFIGNILKCRPDVATPAGNRKPTPAEMETCIPWLWRQID